MREMSADCLVHQSRQITTHGGDESIINRKVSNGNVADLMMCTGCVVGLSYLMSSEFCFNYLVTVSSYQH